MLNSPEDTSSSGSETSGSLPFMTRISPEDQINGMWYLQYAIKGANNNITEDQKCLRNIYNLNDDGTMDFIETALPKSGAKTSDGKAYYCSVTQDSTHGEVSMHYYDKADEEKQYKSQIMGTDYKHYMIAYSCDEHYGGTWILSRSKSPIDESTKTAVQNILKGSDISLEDFEVTPNDNCP